MISSQHIKLTMDSMRKGTLIQVLRFLSPNFSLPNQRSPRNEKNIEESSNQEKTKEGAQKGEKRKADPG